MIVITRHSDTIKLLKEKGIITDNDIILDHVDNIEQIEGQVVLGTLPIDLAAYCQKILFIKWNIPLEARGREWTYEETKAYYNGISEYKVISLDYKLFPQ